MIWLLVACGGAPQSGDCPPGMLAVPAGDFTSGATAEDVGAVPDWPEKWNLPRPVAQRTTDAYCIDAYEYPNAKRSKPQVWIGWRDAQAACADQGKRLCTEDEWTKACVGPSAWMEPYGPEHVEGTCHDDVPVGEEGQLGRAGAHPACVSAYGVFDLQGNVSEWVSDPWEGDPTMRVLRGGTMWLSIYGQGCMARHAHQEHGPTHGDDGFRCCADAP